MEPTILSFDYKISRVGNGFSTVVPNLKSSHMILSAIVFRVNVNSMEVAVNHGGNCMKYNASYFQIFDRINLKDCWYRLADGDRVELQIKNKSPKDFELTVEYHYEPSRGILINSSEMVLRDLRGSTLLADLAGNGMLTQLYIKTEADMTSLRFQPMFRRDAADPPAVVQFAIENEKEVILDFSADEELAAIRHLLAYYQLQITGSNENAPLYILAYGFK